VTHNVFLVSIFIQNVQNVFNTLPEITQFNSLTHANVILVSMKKMSQFVLLVNLDVFLVIIQTPVYNAKTLLIDFHLQFVNVK
jgi:hypothetical protein